MKRKSFPFYYEKYIAGTYYLTRREKGAYIDLLCFQADKGSMTIDNIREVLNGDFDCWDKIKGKFTEQDGVYVNKKLQAINNGTDKPVVNIEEIEAEIKKRKDKLYKDMMPFIGKYPKEMLRAFYNYWTERNKSGVRMRFELQQTFEIGKRLGTWASRDKEFIKGKEDLPTYKYFTYEQMLDKLDKAGSDPAFWKSYTKVKLDKLPQPVWVHVNDAARYNLIKL